jgi:(p)ppGpp synthase/HD superfamily hydrolase
MTKDFTLEQLADIIKARNYAFKLHDITVKQIYDEELKLPYSYHLQLTADFGFKYIHLLPPKLQVAGIQACYVHDAVEDARVTFNDIEAAVNTMAAQMSCNLCSDIWGTNRKRRNSPAYYDRINSHIVSVFAKLCDRMANMFHSKLVGSSMYKKYQNEMTEFLKSLDFKEEFKDMRDLLRSM